jgi:putative ABC transport system permease protein
MKLFILAWKNIWRNRLRSLVMIAAFTIGILAGIFTIAFVNGMAEQRIQAITDIELSHIQIHASGFRDNGELTLFIPDGKSYAEEIRQKDGVAGASARIVVSGMAASAENAAGISILAVDPEHEGDVSAVAEKISEGEWFGSKGKNAVVISKRLAEKLKLKLRNKIILTFQDVSGNIVSNAFRIAGVFSTDNANFDESTVFVNLETMAGLCGIENNAAHQIAVKMEKTQAAVEMRETLQKTRPDLEVLDWLQLSPEAASLIGMMDQYMIIFMIIILLALCFGIVNTMLMAVMERTRETGMLMALGMSKPRIFSMILLETVLLSVAGGILGLVSGIILAEVTARTGINLSAWGEAYADLGYSAIIYPLVSAKTIAETVFLILITGITAAVYPAMYALKIKPAIAIRQE